MDPVSLKLKGALIYSLRHGREGDRIKEERGQIEGEGKEDYWDEQAESRIVSEI